MYHLPSTWRRLVAHFVDRSFIFVLQSPVWVCVVADYFRSGHLRISWPHLAYVIFVGIAYETFSLYFFSTTLGKWQWGLRVISRNPNRGDLDLRFDQALLRVVTTRLSFYFGWSLFAPAFLKYNRTHIADWVAHTQVVSKKERVRRPKVRWVLALGFVFLFASESIKTAAMTLNSLSWQKPFIYFQSKEFKKMIEEIEQSAWNEDDE